MGALTEEASLVTQARDIKKKIKWALFERDMSQVELAELINENKQQVNRAIGGDMSPKSRKIRNKIYRILGI